MSGTRCTATVESADSLDCPVQSSPVQSSPVGPVQGLCEPPACTAGPLPEDRSGFAPSESAETRSLGSQSAATERPLPPLRGGGSPVNCEPSARGRMSMIQRSS